MRWPVAIRLDARDADFARAFAALLNSKRESAPDVDASVAAIIADVRARGDQAIAEYTERFDRLTLRPDRFRLSDEEITEHAAHASSRWIVHIGEPGLGMLDVACWMLGGGVGYFVFVLFLPASRELALQLLLLPAVPLAAVVHLLPLSSVWCSAASGHSSTSSLALSELV